MSKNPLAEEWYEKWQLELRGADDLEQAVFFALGGASACWSNLAGAGEFQSDRATMIGQLLLAEIERRTL